MSEIVNGKTMPTVSRKDDLYAKVSFGDLYGYNAPIMNVMELSEKLFTKYIDEGIKALQESAENYAEIEITKFRREITEGAADADIAKILVFTAIPLIDAYLVDENAAEMGNRLNEYIEIGLYPLIVNAPAMRDAEQSYEKFGNVSEGVDAIGTIIKTDVIHGKLCAIVMWDPWATLSQIPYRELFSYGCCYACNYGIIPTPDVWKDDSAAFLNFGVPMFAHHAFSHELAAINAVPGFTDFLNEALVTGNLRLDFMDKTLAMMNNTLSQIPAIPEEHDEEPRKVQNVPIEDASITDDFGHRLHLYDTPPDPETDYNDDDLDDLFDIL